MNCHACGQPLPKDKKVTKTLRLADKIIKMVSDGSSIPRAAIGGNSRHPNIVKLRYCAMVLIHNHVGLGPVVLAKMLNRAHATVWAALKRHSEDMKDATYASVFNKVTAKLK